MTLLSRARTCYSVLVFHWNYMSVCRTVSEIFSVKEWRDLQTGSLTWLRGRWKWRRLIVRLSIGRPLLSRPYSCMLYHFQVIWRWIIVTLKRLLKVRSLKHPSFEWPSLKVIQTGIIRKLGCSFLFALHSNNGSILHYLQEKAKYWSQIVIFFIPPYIRRPR